jgi:hypothetical protein
VCRLAGRLRNLLCERIGDPARPAVPMISRNPTISGSRTHVWADRFIINERHPSSRRRCSAHMPVAYAESGEEDRSSERVCRVHSCRRHCIPCVGERFRPAMTLDWILYEPC